VFMWPGNCSNTFGIPRCVFLVGNIHGDLSSTTVGVVGLWDSEPLSCRASCVTYSFLICISVLVARQSIGIEWD
jgi:hypothetical protein